MGVTAASLKIGIFENFSKKLYEKADEASYKIHDYTGQAKAFIKAEKKVNDITQEVSQLSKDGKLTIDEAKLIVKYLMEASKHFHEQSEETARSAIVAEGKAAGLIAAAKESAKEHDKAAEDLEKFKNIDKFVNVDGPGSARPVGTHPGPSLKTQRQAEKAAEEAAKKAAEEKKEKPKKTRKPAAKKTRAKKPSDKK